MRTFKTKDDVLTLLIHLGYLVYNSEKREAFIPNKEIMEEFENAICVGGWQEVMHVLKAIACGAGICGCGVFAVAQYRETGAGGGIEI